MSTQVETATVSASSASAPSGHIAIAWSGTAGSATIAAISGTSYTPYCLLTGFGFSIPAGASLTDISATINRTWSTNSGSPTISTDKSVQLIIAGSPSGELGSGASWSGSQTYDAGTAATITQINDNANFGIAISGLANGPGSSNMAVNSATITVTYVAPDESGMMQSRTVFASPTSVQRAELDAYQLADFPLTLRPGLPVEGADVMDRRVQIWNRFRSYQLN